MAFKICAHIKRSGDRCGSPALRGATLCYQHYRYCKRCKTLTVSRHGAMPREEQQEQQPKPTINLEYFGPIRDNQSLRRAIGFVMQELAANRMKRKQAGTLLYGLQMAAISLRRSG